MLRRMQRDGLNLDHQCPIPTLTDIPSQGNVIRES